MKLTDLPENRLYAVLALAILLFFGLGLLVGYYIGINVAEGFYAPQIENCVVLPLK